MNNISYKHASERDREARGRDFLCKEKEKQERKPKLLSHASSNASYYSRRSSQELTEIKDLGTIIYLPLVKKRCKWTLS
jgi:hypothetical protein